MVVETDSPSCVICHHVFDLAIDNACLNPDGNYVCESHETSPQDSNPYVFVPAEIEGYSYASEGASAPLTAERQPLPMTRAEIIAARLGTGKPMSTILNTEYPPPSFLPVLGQPGYIVKGWSHVLSSPPFGGKSELVTRMATEWHETESVLYLSEESEQMWNTRLGELPESCRGLLDHIVHIPTAGKSPDELFALVAKSSEVATVVIVDTIAAVFGIDDWNDAAKVRNALKPWVETTTGNGQTLIMLHHDNKAGGSNGKGISGSYQFLAAVNVYLQVKKMDGQNQLTGNMRVFGINKPLTYAWPSYDVQAPKETVTDRVKREILQMLTSEFRPTSHYEVAANTTRDTADRVLKALAKENLVECRKEGKDNLWRGTIKSLIPVIEAA